MSKPELKKRAIEMRNDGKSYSEILEKVSVAKSTLSRWLKDVNLSKQQKQRLTAKKKEAQKRGAEAVQQKRIEKTKQIKDKARKEIVNITDRELWLIGTALYWAEGSKEKPHQTSVTTEFSNSDSDMVALYIKWLLDIVNVEKERIKFGIYIHETHRDRIEKVKEYWSEHTGFAEEKFDYVYYKNHNPETKRKITDSSYHGVLQVRVSKSTDLTRKIMGWYEGIIDNIT